MAVFSLKWFCFGMAAVVLQGYQEHMHFIWPFSPWLTVSFLTLHRNAFHMYTLGSCMNPSVYTKIYSCKNIIGTGRDMYEDHCAWLRWLPTGVFDTSI